MSNEQNIIFNLNVELLEQLDVTCKWLLQNNVQIPNKEKLYLLMKKADTLLTEIYSMPNTKQNIRRFFTERKSDKDFTEPEIECWHSY